MLLGRFFLLGYCLAGVANLHAIVANGRISSSPWSLVVTMVQKPLALQLINVDYDFLEIRCNFWKSMPMKCKQC